MLCCAVLRCSVFEIIWTVVHGDSPGKKWVAIPSSRGSYQSRGWTQVSYIAGRFFTSWATRKAPLHYASANESRSAVSDSLKFHGKGLLFPWEFSRQEYWSGLPFPSPGNLPNPGMEARSPALQADSIIWATRESHAEASRLRNSICLKMFVTLLKISKIPSFIAAYLFGVFLFFSWKS